MGIRTMKPTSPGRRGMQVSDWADLTHGNRNKPEKKLLEKIKKSGGRNHHGRITVRGIGGGHKEVFPFVCVNQRLMVSANYPPGQKAFTVIPPDAFAPVFEAKAGAIEQYNRTLVADFTYEFDGEAEVEDFVIERYRFSPLYEGKPRGLRASVPGGLLQAQFDHR